MNRVPNRSTEASAEPRLGAHNEVTNHQSLATIHMEESSG